MLPFVALFYFAMSALNSTQAIVDDRDRRIVYNDPKNWFKGGVSQEYNTTETGTFTKGSTARFSFNGAFAINRRLAMHLIQ